MHMTQIGAHVLVGVAQLGMFVYDEDGHQVCVWRPAENKEPVKASDIAEAPTGEVVVLDANNAFGVDVYRPDGTWLRRFGESHFELRHGCLVVTSTGHVIVVGQRTLFTFRLCDGHLLHQRPFKPASQISNVRLTPCGQFFLAANWYHGCIDLFRVSDGSFVHRWNNSADRKIFSSPNDVFVWKGCLVVANMKWVSFTRQSDGALLFERFLLDSRPHGVIVTNRKQLLWVSDCTSSCIRVYSLRTRS